VAAAVAEYGDGLSSVVHGALDASDHWPFEEAGYQACVFSEGEVPFGNPYYHTPQDNVDMFGYIDYAFATRLTRSIVGLLVDLAEVDVPVNLLDFGFPGGLPEYIDPLGGTTISVEVIGVGTEVPQPGTGMLHYDTGAGWQAVPMDIVLPNVYEAVLPSAVCPDEVAYYFSAQSMSGGTYSEPRNAPGESFSAIAAYGQTVVFQDNFETDQGWTVSTTATDGQWERGVPIGGGDRGDPPTDADGSGQCFLTDNVDGNSDVDSGSTTLTSPVMDASAGPALISYYRWYSNTSGSNPQQDIFVIEVSDNGGLSWVNLETVGPSATSPNPEVNGGWFQKEFALASIPGFNELTSQFRIRFIASDTDPQSVVEAGVDLVKLFWLDCEALCPTDVNGDGATNVLDLIELLLCFGQPATPPCDVADITDDGTVNVLDLIELLLEFGAVCP
jgi:hypothetical protein